MLTLRLEVLRFQDLATGAWREGDPYLVTAGADDPVRSFESPLGHEEFLDLIRALRYQADGGARLAALQAIGVTAAQLLGPELLSAARHAQGALHLDLVLNPAEVAALPVEAAVDEQGEPLFVQRSPALVVTRRVRAAFAPIQAPWPTRPRVLMAWAAPAEAGEVPAAEHEAALRGALAPWAPAERDDPVLTVLANVGLASLQQACNAAAAAGRPFSHVHLLAHGQAVGDAHKLQFGLALQDESGALQAATPAQVGQALQALAGQPVMLTLAACDGANRSNTLISRHSLADTLHRLGLPVVVASQFPLTVAGSTLLVDRFYTALFDGQDLRLALQQARQALYDARQAAGHDWVSLVAYVRLPEAYDGHLLDLRLAAALARLKALQRSADALIGQCHPDPAARESLLGELRLRIAGLQDTLADSQRSGQRGVVVEHLGLLGSAEKRLAEMLFRHGDKAAGAAPMRQALQRAATWYRRAFEQDLSNHWAGVQQLSLEAVLEGRLQRPVLWQAARAAAEIALDNPDPLAQTWALGSLAELDLLAPLAGAGHAADGADPLVRLRTLVADGDRFPIDSTARQLRRYVDWWTSAQGFFPGYGDLAAAAQARLAVLLGP